VQKKQQQQQETALFMYKHIHNTQVIIHVLPTCFSIIKIFSILSKKISYYQLFDYFQKYILIISVTEKKIYPTEIIEIL